MVLVLIFECFIVHGMVKNSFNEMHFKFTSQKHSKAILLIVSSYSARPVGACSTLTFKHERTHTPSLLLLLEQLALHTQKVSFISHAQ